MASTQRLPMPGRQPGDEQEELSFGTNASSWRHHHPSESFFSTTTAPLRDDDDDTARMPASARVRTSSATSVTSSIMDRGRPKSRSSFFGSAADFDDPDDDDNDADGDDEGDDAPGARPRRRGGDTGHWASSNGGTSRPSSFFGVRSPSPGPSSAPPALQNLPPGAGPPANGNGLSDRERRSSFYGLDAHVSAGSTPSPVSSLPGRIHANGGDSPAGSGSYSSHSYEASLYNNKARYQSAPYAASRAASLYGMPSEPDVPHVPAAPLFDHSHLHPGAMASLLSHEKTLELYRANARKTNDPEIQFEFCTFVMEVVGEMMQQSTVAGASAAGKKDGGGGTPPDGATDDERHKREALITESVSLLSKLAHRGHVKSQYFLADCYTQGIGTSKGKRDYDKAYPLFVLAGKHGHADACFRAAQCCEHGWGCSRSSSKAVTLLRRGSALGHPGAMLRLGLAEINGELGLAKRPREGVKWLKRAAELADQVEPPEPQSLHELALLSEKGIDNVIFKDEEYAAELLARASELQYAPSAYKLGECYEYGRMGCPQDSALSIHYYNIAAQQNHREACFALTAWYLVGSPGVLPQSDTEAYLWARKAADMGLAKAEYAVGYFTEVGIGTFKDQREAMEWFRKAAGQGDKRARDRLRQAGSGVSYAFARPPPVQQHPLRRSSPQQSLPSPAPPPPPTMYKPPPVTKRIRKDPVAPGPARPQSMDRMRDADGRGRGNGREGDDSQGYSRRPPMRHQRSHSQPPAQPPLLPPVPSTQQLEYEPLAYADEELLPRSPPPVPSVQFKPIQPGQVRAPVRHGEGGYGEKDAHTRSGDKVLQKKKAPDDKDCVIS